MASTNCRVSFEFRVPYHSEAQYILGEVVRSPQLSIGDYETCLLVFPRGTASAEGKAVSAFVEVRPQDATGDWELPDVKYSISVYRRGQPAEERKDKHTFNNLQTDRGWHDMIHTTKVRVLQGRGYLLPAQMELVFLVEVAGNFLQMRPTKRAKLGYGTELWRDMKFTDMVLCAQDDGGPELPCHRSVLAKSSEVFDRMLSSDMREGSERRLVIRNADIETLRAFLEYIYTGSLPEVAVGNAPYLQELLALGDLYGMPELVTNCAQKLTGLLSAANVGVVFRALRCELVGISPLWRRACQELRHS
ncbi:unnamed protein product [Polarella glacialis]|uniref:BTB domain-containing protein n=1 Tax=Polarella glacialis TaxID=89957 RepID=A0A813FS25_POLGL|nr:unnamed protein product [Polarella glacialis]